MGYKDHLPTQDSNRRRQYKETKNILASSFIASPPALTETVTDEGIAITPPSATQNLLNPLLDDIQDLSDNVATTINISLKEITGRFHRLQLPDVGAITVNFVDLVKNKAEEFWLDITKENPATTPTVTFNPSLVGLAQSDLDNNTRLIVPVIARDTEDEVRFDVFAGFTGGGGGTVPNGTANNDHLQWNGSAWIATQKLSFDNDVIAISWANALATGFLEIKVDASDFFDFTDSSNGPVVLQLRAQHAVDADKTLTITQESGSAGVATLNSGTGINIDIGATDIAEFSVSGLEMIGGVDIEMNQGQIQNLTALVFEGFASVGKSISEFATGIHYDIENSAHSHVFRVLGNPPAEVFRIDNDQVVASQDINFQANLLLGTERADPSTPAANTGVFYVKDSGGISTPFFMGDDGVPVDLTTGTGFANTSLSNLVNPTTVNQDLQPDTTDIRDIGDFSFYWDVGYFRRMSFKDNKGITNTESGIGSSATSLWLNQTVLTNDVGIFFDGVQEVSFDHTAGQVKFLDPLNELRIEGGSARTLSLIVPALTGNVLFTLLGGAGTQGFEFTQFVEFGSGGIVINPIGDADFNAHEIIDIANITMAANGDIVNARNIDALSFRLDTDPTVVKMDLSASGFVFDVAASGDAISFDFGGVPHLTVSESAVTGASGIPFLVNSSITLTHITDAYVELSNIVDPPTPAAGFGRIFLDSADDELKIIHSDASVVSLESGGGVTLPLVAPIINHGNASTASPITPNLSLTTAHWHQVTMNANLTINNPTGAPATGNVITYTFEFIGDGTARTISWGTAYQNPPQVKGTGTTILNFTTTDGGTTYKVYETAFRPVSGGGGNQTPWLSDIDANGNDLLNVGGIQINNPADTFQYILTPGAITADRILNLPVMTGTDTLVLNDFAATLTNKTLTTPTIADFTNATHDHSNAAGGGNLTNSALTSGVFGAITGIGTLSQNLVAGDNSITGLNAIMFTDAGGQIAGSTTTPHMNFVLTGTSVFRFTTNAFDVLDISDDGLTMIGSHNILLGNNDITGVNQIAFNEANQTITDSTTGINISVPDATDTIDLIVNGRIFSVKDGIVDLSTNRLDFTEQAIPATPPANQATLYAKDDGGNSGLFWKNDAGTEFDLSAASAVQKLITEGDSKVEVNDAGVGSVDIFVDSLGARKFWFTATAFNLGALSAINISILQGKDTGNLLSSLSTGWQMQVDAADQIGLRFGANEKYTFQDTLAIIGEDFRFDDTKGIRANSLANNYMYFTVAGVEPTTMGHADNVGALIGPYKADTTDNPSSSTLNNWFGDQNGAHGFQYDSDGPETYRFWAKLNGTWHKVVMT